MEILKSHSEESRKFLLERLESLKFSGTILPGKFKVSGKGSSLESLTFLEKFLSGSLKFRKKFLLENVKVLEKFFLENLKFWGKLFLGRPQATH